MSLNSGTKLGPYEILSPLGAGGMGEVYRARDSRLKREVAVKVLPPGLSLDADRLHRFEQEALATAALNHPNILAVFDIGSSDGSPYVVSELLEGETLRERLRGGALPVRKALDYALQIAHGLAAAHEKGIVHRDLKPENLFITKDGRVKILDFGLAKLTQIEAASQTALATMTHATEAGMVLGTAGYMSPEQVRGVGVDSRSDIFSYGAILYEMLSGKRAFHRDTAADTMSAILKEDPPDLAETNRNVSPALERIVQHCLEKSPEQRFHSARDVAFDLETLSAISGTSASMRAEPAASPRGRRVAVWLAAGLGLAALVFFAGRFSGAGSGSSAAPEIHQLTFRRGRVGEARFAPDGQTMVYSASWEGAPREIFTTSEQSPEARSLELKDAEVLAISSTGQLAIKQQPHNAGAFARPGTMATVPLSGGSPRALLDEVEAADWSPDGSQMAVVQRTAQGYSLQYPIGKTLFTAPNWVSHARISPSGERVAFENHPFGGDEGSVMVIEKSGKVRELSSGFLSLQGLAWAPDEKEVWFTGTRVGGNRALFAVTLSGKERVVARIPGCLTVHDIGSRGRVLMTESYERAIMMAQLPGANERDFSWFDYTIPSGLSGDGKSILLAEVGEGGGDHYTTYLRPTDGSPAIRLGEGQSADLSNDGKYGLSRVMANPTKLFLLPAQGAPRELPMGAINPGMVALFVPGTHKVLFDGSEPGHSPRVFLMDPDSSAPPKAVVPEGVFGLAAVTSDGNFVVARNEKREPMFYPIAGGDPKPVQGMQPQEQIFGIGSDNRTLFVGRTGELPQRLYRLDSTTGQRQPFKEIAPADRTGTDVVGNLRVFQDGKAYFYSYFRSLSELYVFRGLN
jgi:hypothetical protein